MMIDFALAAEREQGMSPREAIFQACLLRFRPILMTSLAFVLGMLPMVLASGPGSASRHSIGTGVFFWDASCYHSRDRFGSFLLCLDLQDKR